MSELSAEELAYGDPQGKEAKTVPLVNELIRKRWSPRAFSEREVSTDDLRSLLEAARWASSSYNEQPWRFFIGRKPDTAAFEKLLSILVPANQAWAKSAPVLMLTVAKNTMSHSGAENRYAMHDTGQAFAQLSLQAVSVGLHVHGMAGFDRDRARTVLNIPPDYELGCALAVGYAGSPDHLAENYRQMEIGVRTRKPLNEIAFGSSWGTPAPL